MQKKGIKRGVKAKVKGSKGGRNPNKGDKFSKSLVSVVQFEGGDESLQGQESGVVQKK